MFLQPCYSIARYRTSIKLAYIYIFKYNSNTTRLQPAASLPGKLCAEPDVTSGRETCSSSTLRRPERTAIPAGGFPKWRKLNGRPLKTPRRRTPTSAVPTSRTLGNSRPFRVVGFWEFRDFWRMPQRAEPPQCFAVTRCAVFKHRFT